MRAFINRKTREVFTDFQDELVTRGKCCDLKDVRYDEGNIPDYSNVFVQQLYMLRYFPAYFAEYYGIFQKVLSYNFIEDNIYNVFSFGSGCGVEYYGLYYAMRDIKLDPNSMINFTGLDCVDWNYRENLGNENCNFINENINDLVELYNGNYNTLIFPKSIGEFDANTFKNLKGILKHTEFESDKIWIISSIREKYVDGDVNKLQEIISVMTKNHDYECLDEINIYWHYEGDSGLRKYFYDFVYPDDIKDFIENLIDNCQGYIANGEHACTDICEQYLSRSPILKANHIRYKIIRLSRGE